MEEVLEKLMNHVGIIQFDKVSKAYLKNEYVFRDVNVTINSGAFVVVRGKSGSGKTTLLNLIGGLELPSSGRVIVDGKSVNDLKAKQRTDFYRQEVGIIFQGSYLQPQLSLLENITLPGVFAGVAANERKQRAERWARILGISDNLNHLPKEVSGGQAERACIARALLLNPKIILADEPTSSLDDDNAKKVLGILDAIRLRLGVTVVVSSHSRGALEFATQMLTVSNGTVYDDSGNV